MAKQKSDKKGEPQDRSYGNYMGCLAPGDRNATELRGVDQAAMQARMAGKERRESERAGGPVNSFDWDSYQRECRATEPLEKRKLRGGGTFGKGDLLSQY